MIPINILNEYFPADVESIPESKLRDARLRVVDYLQPFFPDMDMSPGTVVGDWIVSPASVWLAATEEAHGRFRSDLDPENVANGIIYSCDFVRRYLGNFAVYENETLKSTGLVRLTVSENVGFSLNKSARFSFGNADEYSLRMPSDDTSTIEVLPAGDIVTNPMTQVTLSQTSINTWAVDLPLVGSMTEGVLRGEAGSSNLTIPTLISLTAAVDFEEGLPSNSLPDLARLARRMAYAASVNSRHGTRSYVLQSWPETAVVSPVVTGDPEMLRSPSGTSLILQAPAVDLYFRSKRDMQQEVQTVKLLYMGGVFRGQLPLLHRPSLIESIRWAGNPTLDLEDQETYVLVDDFNLAGGLGLGSTRETIWAEIVPPPRPGGGILIDLVNDENGDPYAMFEVTYRADPLLGAVSRTSEARDNTPVGVNVVVKAGPLVVLDSLVIRYRKQPGYRMLLDEARSKIADYFATLGYPEVFSEAALESIMRLAGAQRTQGISYSGWIRFAAANRIFALGAVPSNPLSVWEDQSDVLLKVPIASRSDMNPDYINLTEGVAATERNVRYYIDPANIVFEEL